MTLNQEISLPGFLTGNKKAPKELKTEINFISVTTKDKKSISVYIPLIILIILLLVVIGKFAVVDRYVALAEKHDQIAALKEEIAVTNERIENSGELKERFYHYTSSMMTDEEKNNIKRADVLDLLRFIGDQGVTLLGADITGNTLVVSVRSVDLRTISDMSRQLEDKAMVSSVSVTTAQTTQNERITEDLSDGVNASVRIYLKTRSQMQEEEQG